MADELEIPELPACDTGACVVKIDIGQVNEIYKSMSALVYADMDKQYQESKISGATYAETYAKLMDSVVSGALQAVVSIQNKETDADRCLKEAECDLSAAKKELTEEQRELIIIQKEEIELESARKNAANREQIASSEAKTANETCIATSTCALNNAKEKAESIKNGDTADGTSLYGYNKDVLQKQSDLYVRQRQGFSDNARQKVLDSQISAWSIVWKEGSAVIEVPSSVNNTKIDLAVDNVNNNMGTD